LSFPRAPDKSIEFLIRGHGTESFPRAPDKRFGIPLQGVDISFNIYACTGCNDLGNNLPKQKNNSMNPVDNIEKINDLGNNLPNTILSMFQYIRLYWL